MESKLKNVSVPRAFEVTSTQSSGDRKLAREWEQSNADFRNNTIRNGYKTKASKIDWKRVVGKTRSF